MIVRAAVAATDPLEGLPAKITAPPSRPKRQGGAAPLPLRHGPWPGLSGGFDPAVPLHGAVAVAVVSGSSCRFAGTRVVDGPDMAPKRRAGLAVLGLVFIADFEWLWEGSPSAQAPGVGSRVRC